MHAKSVGAKTLRRTVDETLDYHIFLRNIGGKSALEQSAGMHPARDSTARSRCPRVPGRPVDDAQLLPRSEGATSPGPLGRLNVIRASSC
jgi:hypothetical protein